MGGPADLFTKFSSAKMKKQKPQCKYGDKCYRQNPQHFAEYSHGSQSESEVKSPLDGLVVGLMTNQVLCRLSTSRGKDIPVVSVADRNAEGAVLVMEFVNDCQVLVYPMERL